MNLPELRAALAAAEDRKYTMSMSDNFCYSNGTMDVVQIEIRRLRKEIEQAEGAVERDKPATTAA